MSAPPSNIVHIRAKPGGMWSALGIVAGLMLFGFIFLLGFALGIGAMLAGSSMDTFVVEQTYRDAAGARGDKIAIVPVDGIINDSQASFIRAAVDHVLSESSIKAVVLRVNSPGGGVTASDQIWYEVERMKAEGLPVVASYGGLAASGGYYVSCASDYILAEETSVTGSIGVIAQIMTLQNLMNKVGVQPVTLVATGSPEKSVANDIFREWNDRDQEKIMGLLDNAYEIFTTRVAEGRGLADDPEQLRAVANGSVFTAIEAMENKLIDGIGYLDDAILEAERRAGLAVGRARVVRITAPPSLADALLGVSANSSIHAGALDADAIRGLMNDFATPRAMYLMW